MSECTKCHRCPDPPGTRAERKDIPCCMDHAGFFSSQWRAYREGGAVACREGLACPNQAATVLPSPWAPMPHSSPLCPIPQICKLWLKVNEIFKPREFGTLSAWFLHQWSSLSDSHSLLHTLEARNFFFFFFRTHSHVIIELSELRAENKPQQMWLDSQGSDKHGMTVI